MTQFHCDISKVTKETIKSEVVDSSKTKKLEEEEAIRSYKKVGQDHAGV